MYKSWHFLGLPIASAICLVASPSWSLPANQVAEVAKAVTVEIQTENSIGSGVLVAKNPQGYTVLTAAHVVKEERKYELIAPDGRRYGLDRAKIKILPGADLALVSFISTQNYRTVKVRQAGSIAEGSRVYVGGFPLTTQTISKSLFNFTEGRVTASSKQPMQNGYGLVYTNLTLPGMSGGSVLNEQGELVAIHGRGDVEKSSTASAINPDARIKTGFNLGILASVFVPLASQAGLRLEVATTTNNKTTEAGSDGLVSAAVKMQTGDYRGAIAELDRAIAANPKKAAAYYLRANAYQMLGDRSAVLSDLNRAIELDDRNASAYYLRGNVLYANQNYQGAAADFNRTVALDPKYTQAYLLLAIVAQVQGDLPGAQSAYTKMIAIDPQNTLAYQNRAGVRVQLNNFPGAIEDFSQIIKITPENISAYDSRANFRKPTGDLTGAIADYTKIIQLSPNNLRAYSYRAEIYRGRKEWSLALQDYASMVKINPNEIDAYAEQLKIYQQLKDYRGIVKALNGLVQLNPAQAYFLVDRGNAKLELKDRSGAIADYRKSIELYRQQGNTSEVERLTQEIRKLGG
ncbi:tetratricopeptide repeat protein [Chamaesiphon sp. VAR_48_metabat_403]|uniref:tetratricopeptide repeat protein n=1 Tax=Chamaesiphon sp. VAR_48_metabat_403 TaxID=2964700 RepID=UPI00286DC4FA|nr:tetratricopeptide repeat protein [Chamaesiphon sp. VAR_48_metabat_403]